MSDANFTNIRSMLGALAKAMNLINPELEHHHEQTAYFSYFIGRQMGLEEEALHRIVYAALLHDVGSVVVDQQISVAEIEAHAREYTRVGADMIRDLPGFGPIADIIALSQTHWCELVRELPAGDETAMQNARMASAIHLSDLVAAALDPNRRVLNQVEPICKAVSRDSGNAFLPEAAEALLSLRDREVLWLDAMEHPDFLLFFTGEFHRRSLAQTAELTRLMSRIIDYRSAFTAMHSAGVAASARALGRLAGMSESDCLKLEIAGNLHDVGKLVVPRSILEKPGKLTDEEFNIIREHPYYTRLVLMDVEGFDQIANWAGFHHEKLNGKGYPFHFGAADLDLGSRILAVADIFSAITEDRPYRGGMPRERVLSALREDVENRAIDGDLVALLAEHYDEVDRARSELSHQAGARYYAQFPAAED